MIDEANEGGDKDDEESGKTMYEFIKCVCAFLLLISPHLTFVANYLLCIVFFSVSNDAVKTGKCPCGVTP